MKLSANGLSNAQAWQAAGISLPGFDWRAMCDATQAAPVWVHFGAGNIFRGFIAALQQRLLDQGLEKSGIVAAETFDYDIIDKIYAPHDSMTLMVSLLPDGGTRKEVIASIAQGIKANSADQQQWAALCAIFEKPSLQMASFTITEKGYALRDMKGELMGVVKQDMEDGPAKARHAMSVVAALMLKRFEAGAAPMALVSMDNCSHNGEKLRQSVLEIAHAWLEKGHVPLLKPCMGDFQHALAQLFAIMAAIIHAHQRHGRGARLKAFEHQRGYHAHGMARFGGAVLHVLLDHAHQLALHIAQGVALFRDGEAGHLQGGLFKDGAQRGPLLLICAVGLDALRDGGDNLLAGAAVRQ